MPVTLSVLRIWLVSTSKMRGVDPQVAVAVEQRAGHHVVRADQLADPDQRRVVHPAFLAEILLLEDLLQLGALDHADARIGRHLGDGERGEAAAQRVVVLARLPHGQADVEVEHGEAGARVLRLRSGRRCGRLLRPGAGRADDQRAEGQGDGTRCQPLHTSDLRGTGFRSIGVSA